jgi:hypothetical protein
MRRESFFDFDWGGIVQQRGDDRSCFACVERALPSAALRALLPAGFELDF